MRLIDADALMERFAEMQKMGKTDGTEYACNFMSAGQEPSAEWYTIEDAVDNAPTVDAVPVRHGRWERVDYGNGLYNYHCSSCRHIPRENIRSNYCPNCGAKMTEDHHEQKE